LSVRGFVVNGESIFAIVVSKTPVENQIFILGFNSDLVNEVSNGAFTLNATVEVEPQIVLAQESMIVMQFEAIVLDPCVKGAVFAEGEPHFQFISSADFVVFLGECFLEGNG